MKLFGVKQFQLDLQWILVWISNNVVGTLTSRAIWTRCQKHKICTIEDWNFGNRAKRPSWKDPTTSCSEFQFGIYIISTQDNFFFLRAAAHARNCLTGAPLFPTPNLVHIQFMVFTSFPSHLNQHLVISLIKETCYPGNDTRITITVIVSSQHFVST